MRHCVFIFALLLTSFQSQSQDDREDTGTWQEYTDRSSENTFIESILEAADNENDYTEGTTYQGENVIRKNFNKEEWREVVGATDYTEQMPKSKTDQKKKSENTENTERKKESGENSSVSISSPWSGQGFAWITYLLIGAAALYFLYLVIQNISIKNNPKITGATIGVNADVENIEELEIDKLLREARNAGDYRLVVRLQYLGLLKSLHENGMITWEKDKTNREYMLELFSKEVLYQEFRRLTLDYELVWYGEYPIDKDGCDKMSAAYAVINGHLSQKNS